MNISHISVQISNDFRVPTCQNARAIFLLMIDILQWRIQTLNSYFKSCPELYSIGESYVTQPLQVRLRIKCCQPLNVCANSRTHMCCSDMSLGGSSWYKCRVSLLQPVIMAAVAICCERFPLADVFLL